ncbi:MAG: hypothetical protein ACAH88_10480 [Roseimicrobium sp.]
MQTTIIEQPALRLITAKAATFPGDTSGAFQVLESRLPTLKGRKMYGLVYGTANGLEYYAGLVPESEAEEQDFGMPIIEVPAGPCARRKLENWMEHTDQIGMIFDEMITQYGMDRSRPTMEYYRSAQELHLLVPIERKPVVQ